MRHENILICACCGKEPAKIKSRRLCQGCYSRLRRENRLEDYPDWPEPVMIPAHFDWLREAACRGIDPGMFFDPNLSHEAKAVCAGCPVTVECRGLADAYETSNGKGHVWGIFGGETPAERITRRKGKRVHGTGEPVMTRFPDLAGSEAAS